MTEQEIIKALEQKVNGKLWERYDKRRIYIESSAIWSALRDKLNDMNYDGGRDEMSKETARSVYGNIGKIFYNLNSGKFSITMTEWGRSDIVREKLAEVLYELITED